MSFINANKNNLDLKNFIALQKIVWKKKNDGGRGNYWLDDTWSLKDQLLHCRHSNLIKYSLTTARIERNVQCNACTMQGPFPRLALLVLLCYYLWLVHATARVDRLRGDQTWTKFFPTSRPAPVNLASDLMPSFTRLWFPVASFNRMQQFER